MKESEVKKSVADYLQYQRNLGELIYFRLNAGSFIVTDGQYRRRIQGAPKGTADYLVVKDGQVIFLEIKSEKGKLSPEQIEFSKEVQKQKAIYFIVRSLEDLTYALYKEDLRLWE